MQAKKDYMQQKIEKTNKENENLTYANGETDRSKLKSSPRGSML